MNTTTTKTGENCARCTHWVKVTPNHGACASEIARMEAGHVVAFGDVIVRNDCTCIAWVPNQQEDTFTRAEIRYAMRDERIIDVPDGLFDLIFRE